MSRPSTDPVVLSLVVLVSVVVFGLIARGWR